MGNSAITPQILHSKEIKCNDKYDDFLLCQKQYGFNDLKCRNYYFQKYEKCIRKLVIHIHMVRNI